MQPSQTATFSEVQDQGLRVQDKDLELASVDGWRQIQHPTCVSKPETMCDGFHPWDLSKIGQGFPSYIGTYLILNNGQPNFAREGEACHSYCI